ncbi:MAG: DUF819 family protein [Planctomycetes bacterium]|nr:DUF819 family protein [Planctomycetota bacterium]
MRGPLIESPAGILAVLAGVTSLFFWLEKRTGWRVFKVLPPLVFIYLVPIALSNTSVIPVESTAYTFLSDSILPLFLVLLLMNIDVGTALRVMGRGIAVMLLGTAGVVVGAVVSFAIVGRGLGPDAWKGFGALAGSWIGGTGNMSAVSVALELDPRSLDFGYAVVADHVVYLIWLPLLLASKNLAGWFGRFAGVPDGRLAAIERAAETIGADTGRIEMRHYLYLAAIGFAVTALSTWIASPIPPVPPVLSAGTYKILLVTVFGIGLSFTGARSIPGSQPLGTALVYLFVARMGASADLSKLDASVIWFLAGAFLWIAIHGAFLIAGARLLRVDVHTAAIASAANIGGAASAPIVAAYHRPALVPVSVLMALIGYAIGNPAAILAAFLCERLR